MTQYPILARVMAYLCLRVIEGVWGLEVLLCEAESDYYLSLCDTLISLHHMSLCSALCTNGSALFGCRNVHVCEKDSVYV